MNKHLSRILPALLLCLCLTLLAVSALAAEPTHYTVTYMDGSTVLDTTPVANGSYAAIVPSPPDKEGYQFVGWYMQDGTMHEFGSLITSDLTLFATYRPISYSITVAGTPVNYETKDDVLGDGGSVKYDPATHTLTLTDASIESAEVGIMVESSINSPLTIHGVDTAAPGNNSIRSTDRTAILCYTDLTLTGSFGEISSYEESIYVYSVTIEGDLGNITSETDDGIYAYGDLTVSGAVGNVTVGDDGIYAYGDLTVSGSVGNVTAGDDGIFAYGDLTVSATGIVGDITAGEDGLDSNSNLTISGTVGNIAATDDALDASGDLTVTATGIVGDITAVSEGFDANGDLTISGTVGNITAQTYDGIYANGDLTISGTVGNITAQTYDGIYAEGDLTISGTVGNITAQTYDGICAEGDLTISGIVGNITAGETGIDAGSDLTIDGEVGCITTGEGDGIYAIGDLTIDGEVGCIDSGYDGIYSYAGAIAISGSVGNITADRNGIDAEDGLTISGTVGDINTGNDGLYSEAGGITIPGSVGDITAGDDGLYSNAGDITIPGCVGNITAGDDGLDTGGNLTITGTVGNITAGDINLDVEGTSNTPGLISPVIVSEVKVEESEHGTVKPNSTVAAIHSPVTLTVTPEKGCKLDSLSVTGAFVGEVPVTEQEDGTWTFTMPFGDVTVKAEFSSALWVRTYGACPGGEACPLHAFEDLTAYAEHHDALHFAVENGLLLGCGDSLFLPEAEVSRAMLATVLWRAEDCPAVTYPLPFEDVPAEDWYTGAVRWAVSEGLMTGTENTFSPDAPISRGELIPILWRFTQKSGNLSGMAKAMGFIVTLPETGPISRAELAVTLKAYCVG